MIQAFEAMPVAYSDLTGRSWQTWLSNFETRCRVEDMQKLQCMKFRISPDLMKCFETVCTKVSSDYCKVKTEFPKALFKETFYSKKKADSVTWKNIYDDLCLLANGFVPDTEHSKVVVLQQLLKLVEEQGIILPKRPETHKEALALLEATIGLSSVQKYSGEGSWESWFKSFESALPLMELSEDNKIQLLKKYLDGRPLKLFESLTQKHNYDKARREFEMKLDLEQFQSLSRSRFKNWEEYATELRAKAEIAYGNLKCAERENKVLEHFLGDKWILENLLVKSAVERNKPTTIEVAVIMLMALEAMPQVYSDKTGISWQIWLNKLERTCKVKNTQQLQYMKFRISEDLMPLFQSVCTDMSSDYVRVKTAFPKALAFYSRVELSAVSWKDFCDDLCLLAKDFVTDKKHNEVVLAQLLQISEKQGIMLTVIPITIEDALIRISLYSVGICSVDTNWETWLQRFELAINMLTLTEDKKISVLRNHMDDKARLLFDSLQSSVRHNYIQVTESFAIALYKHKFQSLTRNDYKSCEQFANALDILVVKAFPGMSIGEREKKVLKHFLVNNADIQNLNPESIDVAKDIMNATEAISIKYSGLNSLDIWIDYFENMIKSIHVNPTPKVLCSCLTDSPWETLRSEISKQCVLTYNDAKCVVYEQRLVSIKKSGYSSWKEFADDLNCTANKAYPQINVDQTVLSHLLADNPDVWNLHPNTIEEAISIMNAMEQITYTYSGQDEYNLDGWIEWLEKQLKYHNIIPTHRVLFVCLTGSPREMLKKEIENVISYDDAKCLLYQQKFQSLVRSEFKNCDEFAAALDTMAAKAFPDTDQRITIVLERFLAYYPDVKQFKPTTFESAKDIAKTIENRKTTCSGQDDERSELISEIDDVFMKHNITPTAALLYECLPEYCKYKMRIVSYQQLSYMKCKTALIQEPNTIPKPRETSTELVVPSQPFSFNTQLEECTKCNLKEKGWDGQKCHVEMVFKHGIVRRFFGGIWEYVCEKVTKTPGYNHSQKICCECENGFSTEGCTLIGNHVSFNKKSICVKHACK